MNALTVFNTFERGPTMPVTLDSISDTLTGAYLHVARTVTRRAERLVTRLYLDEVLKNKYNLVYLNRLSSLLFVLALYEDRHGGVESPTYAGAKQL